MATMMDYLKWRGDLDFARSAFNEVDNLILACLSYVDLDEIISSRGDIISVQEAAEKFFTIHTKKEIGKSHSFIRNAPFLLDEMAKTERFQNAQITNYVNIVSKEQEVQFAAMEILIGDGTSYISFRGTDDSLIGWQEDFNMSIGPVPAENASSEYLEQIMAESSRSVRVGGHSKGGHLALYASVKCRAQLQSRILHVYNNDGPGLLPELAEASELAQITPKLTRFVPCFSIFGMLLEHTTMPVIIESDNRGIMQHDAFSWQLDGPRFERCEELHAAAALFSESMSVWLGQMDTAQRRAFVGDLFSVLEASGYETVPQLEIHAIKAIPSMFRQLGELSPDTKDRVETLIRIFFSQLHSS